MNDTYTKALEQALYWITSTYQVVGVVVSGSIIRGNPNSSSDFDIFVIQENSFRQRVQKFFNGVPCEIFVNTLEQIYTYFDAELRNNRPVTAHMLATGQLIKGAENQQLLTLLEAAEHYASLSPVMTDEQRLFRTYGLATLCEDAADIIASDQLTAAYILEKIVADIIEFIFLSRQQPLPRIKERLQHLAMLDETAYQLLRTYYHALLTKEKFFLVKELVLHVAGKAAFFEWSSSPEPRSV